MTRRIVRLAHKIWRRRLTLELLERRDVPSFLAPQAFPAGSSPSDIAGGDFNSDGLDDIVVTRKTSTGIVNLLLNLGGGVFGPPKSFATGGASPSSIAVADLDGDSTLDLAVTNQSSGTVGILRGSGNGTFRQSQTYSIGSSPTSIALSDFNGDGALDLVVANSVNNGMISVSLNNGDGTFRPKQSYRIATRALSVTTGDFNLDGRSDIAAVGFRLQCVYGECYTTNGLLQVFLGNGNGTFQHGRSYFEPAPIDVAAGDFDKDGDLDLVTGTAANDYWYVPDNSIRVRLGSGDGSFAAAISDDLIDAPVVVHAEDLDANGDLDLLALTVTGDVNVLLGDGSGSFPNINRYDTGTKPVGVSLGDYTGDGNRDLTLVNVASSAGTVFFLPGNGSGAFPTAPTYDAGSGLASVLAADLNGDGDPELAVANDAQEATVSVLTGEGGGSFGEATRYSAGASTKAIAAADVTGDGTLDLTVAAAFAYRGGVSVLKGTGDGEFQAPPQYPAGPNPVAVETADLNHDNILDLVVINNGPISILLGTGGGAFRSPITYEIGSNRGLAIADLNGDSHMDIAATSTSATDGVRVLFGKGNGSFQPVVTYGDNKYPYDVEAADLNGDGLPELVVANFTFPIGRVTVWQNDGAGNFQNPVSYVSGRHTRAVALADFNGDTLIDVVAINAYDGALAVLLGNGDGSLQDAVYHRASFAGGLNDVHISDLDSDGRQDLMVVVYSPSGKVAVLLGNGDGTFQPAVQYATGDSSLRGAIEDFDSDGILDVAVTNSAINHGISTVSLLRGNGDGTFQQRVHYLAGNTPYDLVAGDFDGDGCADVVATNLYDETVSVLLGHADGFKANHSYPMGYETNSLAAGDFNSDGINDLVATQSGWQSEVVRTVNVLLATGEGDFARPVNYQVGDSPSAVAVSDLNGDGALDLAVATYTKVDVLLGNGDGTFQGAVSYTGGSGLYALVVGDFNADAIPDIAAANYGNGSGNAVKVLLGNGDGTFQPPGSYMVGQGPRALALADVNGDSTLDLAVANYTAGTVSVLIGNGDGSFQSALTYVVGAELRGIAAGDFDGDGYADLAVTSSEGVKVLLNAADWPPLPIGDWPERLENMVSLHGITLRRPVHALPVAESSTLLEDERKGPESVPVPTRSGVSLQMRKRIIRRVTNADVPAIGAAAIPDAGNIGTGVSFLA